MGILDDLAAGWNSGPFGAESGLSPTDRNIALSQMLAGMAGGFAQAAQPSAAPVGMGQALGMAAAGMGQGLQGVVELQKTRASERTQKLREQLMMLQAVTALQKLKSEMAGRNWYQSLEGPGGSEGLPAEVGADFTYPEPSLVTTRRGPLGEGGAADVPLPEPQLPLSPPASPLGQPRSAGALDVSNPDMDTSVLGDYGTAPAVGPEYEWTPDQQEAGVKPSFGFLQDGAGQTYSLDQIVWAKYDPQHDPVMLDLWRQQQQLQQVARSGSMTANEYFDNLRAITTARGTRYQQLEQGFQSEFEIKQEDGRFYRVHKTSGIVEEIGGRDQEGAEFSLGAAQAYQYSLRQEQWVTATDGVPVQLVPGGQPFTGYEVKTGPNRGTIYSTVKDDAGDLHELFIPSGMVRDVQITTTDKEATESQFGDINFTIQQRKTARSLLVQLHNRFASGDVPAGAAFSLQDFMQTSLDSMAGLDRWLRQSVDSGDPVAGEFSNLIQSLQTARQEARGLLPRFNATTPDEQTYLEQLRDGLYNDQLPGTEALADAVAIMLAVAENPEGRSVPISLIKQMRDRLNVRGWFAGDVRTVTANLAEQVKILDRKIQDSEAYRDSMIQLRPDPFKFGRMKTGEPAYDTKPSVEDFEERYE